MSISMSTGLFEFKYSESETGESALLERHCHFRFEIIAVMSGSIDIMIEGHAYRCQKGEMAVIPPLTYHSVTSSDTSEYKRITALFDGNILPDTIIRRLTASGKISPVYLHPSIPYLTEDLHCAVTKGDPEVYSPLANAIATQLIYSCADDSPADKAERRIEDGGVLGKAIDYLDFHITEKLSLEDISQALFISRSSLCHIFTERMNISPKQYIIQKKMAYATMLIENGMPLTHAARAVGYENYSNFYRMYKKMGTRGG